MPHNAYEPNQNRLCLLRLRLRLQSPFRRSAIALGKVFAENSIRLVYGGGSVGLMGAVAKSVLDHGGTVTGIIPDFLATRENAMTNVKE